MQFAGISGRAPAIRASPFAQVENPLREAFDRIALHGHSTRLRAEAGTNSLRLAAGLAQFVVDECQLACFALHVDGYPFFATGIKHFVSFHAIAVTGERFATLGTKQDADLLASVNVVT